jgi:hypothetical protein
MLSGELNLPRKIFASDGQVVNRLFTVLCKASDSAFAQGFAEIVKDVQQRWFGNRTLPIRCPDCGGSQVIGKGWRSRVLKTSRGRIELYVRQVRCKGCERTFRPFNQALGLTTSRRFLDEFIGKAIMLGVRVPFAYSARVMKELTSGTISGEGVRQQIAKKARSISFSEQTAGETVLVDSTKVKAGKKQRGATVNMAVTAKRGPKRNGRSSIVKKLIHLNVGSTNAVKARLRTVKAQRVVHDGGEDYSDCARYVQRCRWHLVHQLKHYLWQDGIAWKNRAAYQDRLRQILWRSKQRPHQTESTLESFIESLENSGLKTSAWHLRAAKKEALVFHNVEGFSFTTTTPLEREMRELNSRADVGVRWSEKGIENVLKVLFHLRLNQTTQTQKQNA